MKLKAGKSQSDEDLFKHLGEFIEERFKKGVKKVERIFNKTPPPDDEAFSYLRAFIDDKGVASIVPSSKFLVNRVIKAMDLSRARLVVEYGAAEGVMTRKVLERLPASAQLIAVELNPKLFASLKRIADPRLRVVQGDVRQIDKILEGVPPGSVDAIFSGIPFAFLRGRERHELMLKTSQFLRPQGRFVAYQVTTHLLPLLRYHFQDVDVQYELRNLPPHFVFTGIK